MSAAGIPWYKMYVDPGDSYELIEAEFGLTGFAVVVKLLQKIYGGRGYYCEWTKDVELMFAKKIGAGVNSVSEIVSAAVKRGIFDARLFKEYRVLTSEEIQRDYFEAVSRRKKVEVKKEYLLVSDARIYKNVSILGENVNIFDKNDNIFKQRKEEKRIEENRREQPAGAADVRSFDPFIIAVKRGWRIERELTATEENAVAVWRQELDMPAEMIVEAGDICIRNTGKIVIAYINAVLMRWKTEGVFTVDELHRKGNASAPHSLDTGGVYEDSIDHDELERLVWSNLGG